ncbi:4Fe-4S dicluster domain-containing protein [Tepidanaerobacter sp. GT38]|uniref:4Fe-4S dicluster domain-containing protein n=1 Tax=Tepidanaerobacter sp. GT38 TaxID=2722793 RepID=UPI001F2C745D|nr:4Fe-4S dicluster domain-containing protein [Tepidanaerobacter sp. GT38]MCG1013011.1 4Fe-4S dicluster domain-containing protein [Tepidanaerobacter sp. GT38]
MQVREVLREKGVVGAGGAGFPTYAKLKQEGIDYYIANGAECEPLLDVSKEIMARFPDRIVKALSILKDFTGAGSAVIALKGKYKQAVKALNEELSKTKLNIRLFEIGDFYPAGDEQIMVFEVTGEVVPEGGIPLAVGAIVNNIETLYNVYEAIEEDTPVIQKFITVGGQVENPITLKVPIGTTVGWLLDFLGVDYKDKVIVDGGPMMGKIVDLNSPITKVTGGLLIFPKHHPAVSVKESDLNRILRLAKIACIQCRYCTMQCPRYLLGHDLEPSKIMLSVGFNLTDGYIKQAMLCCECGLCEAYSCPQQLSPRRVNMTIKSELAKAGFKYATEKTYFNPRESRQWRKIPTNRLKVRLKLMEFDRPAFLVDGDFVKPPEVHIPMKQHIGAPAVPVVSVGDRVTKFQVVGRVPEDKLGCNIHASIDGTVVHCDGHKIVIRGEDVK